MPRPLGQPRAIFGLSALVWAWIAATGVGLAPASAAPIEAAPSEEAPTEAVKVDAEPMVSGAGAPVAEETEQGWGSDPLLHPPDEGLGDFILGAQEDSSARVSGFADLIWQGATFPENSLWKQVINDENTFFLGRLNLYVESKLGPKVTSLSEVRFLFLPIGELEFSGATGRHATNEVSDLAAAGRSLQWGGIEIERAWVNYAFREYLSVRVGYWLTPYGIWNVDHGSPTTISVQRPFLIDEELLPEHQLGVQVHGSKMVGSVMFAYALTLSNGRGPVAQALDLDDNKGIGARLSAEIDWLGLLTVGASTYTGRYTDREYRYGADDAGLLKVQRVPLVRYDEFDVALDLRWQWKNLTFLGEYARHLRRYTNRGRPLLADLDPYAGVQSGFAPDHVRWAWYALVGYRIEGLEVMPFVMLEQSVRPDRWQFPVAVDAVAGLNYRPSAAVAIKGQLGWVDYPGHRSPYTDVRMNFANVQVAWAF